VQAQQQVPLNKQAHPPFKIKLPVEYFNRFKAAVQARLLRIDFVVCMYKTECYTTPTRLLVIAAPFKHGPDIFHENIEYHRN
jgi:hypothetical protein